MFKALRVSNDNNNYNVEIKQITADILNEGDTLVANEYSGLNYKDALAVTGKGKILKKYPLTPGIDMAGTVEHTDGRSPVPGSKVLITGCNFGEVFDGGFTEKVRCFAQIAIPLPQTLTTREAMIYGTAGFTAALALHRLEHNGCSPEKGPIVVTGASGGVGSFATEFLAKKGYEVIAVTGKKESHQWLKSRGAEKVLSLKDLDLSDRPMDTARFQGAIDNIGGKALSGLLAHTDIYGNVASIGLAESHKLEATVMPFILRGVSLLGISSNNCDWELRRQIWNDLATDLKPEKLEDYVEKEISIDEIPSAAEAMLNRKTSRRTLIKF